MLYFRCKLAAQGLFEVYRNKVVEYNFLTKQPRFRICQNFFSLRHRKFLTPDSRSAPKFSFTANFRNIGGSDVNLMRIINLKNYKGSDCE